jgi:N-acetylglutamate synthase-like GNAT family acetyltransferase
VRHARSEDLDRIDDLLARLRAVDGLVEKKRGSFYRGSRAFLHFHEHQGDIVCDVRLDGPDFERRVVTTTSAQRSLVSDVRRALAGGPGRPAGH